MLARSALAASELLRTASGPGVAFLADKIATARFYAGQLLPQAARPAPAVTAGAALRHRPQPSHPLRIPGQNDSIPLTSARQVKRPTTPSGVSATARWKLRTAAEVLAPKIPSTRSPRSGSPDRLRNWNSS
jgi:hypothetical protein